MVKRQCAVQHVVTANSHDEMMGNGVGVQSMRADQTRFGQSRRTRCVDVVDGIVVAYCPLDRRFAGGLGGQEFVKGREVALVIRAGLAFAEEKRVLNGRESGLDG